MFETEITILGIVLPAMLIAAYAIGWVRNPWVDLWFERKYKRRS
jgi:hypothetical protein